MNTSTIDFITKLLSDSLRLDFHYFIFPYPNLSAFDNLLRDSLENSGMLYDQIKDFLSNMENNCFYFVSDNYSINYIFFYPYPDKKDIITIGPYFNNPITDDYWNNITEKNQLTSTNINTVRGFLYGIPYINNNLHLISIVSNIVSFINKGVTNTFSIEYHNFYSDNNDYIFTPKDDFEAYTNALFQRYEIEKELLSHIRKGKLQEALFTAEKFTNTSFAPRMKNQLKDLKSMLTSANTLFRKTIEDNKIHPVHLHEISSKFANKIELAASNNSLEKLYEQMIKEYCLLVQNKSMNQYSLPVRNILNYIEFNMNSSLTLKDISEKFDLSSPYISSQFKKEVGTTLIRYINQSRIKEATILLDSSYLSIQDIASYVGITDYNYFTKVFKKVTGITPSEYRNNVNK